MSIETRSRKQYIINLNSRRSIIALVVAILVSFATFVAIIRNTLDYSEIEVSFQYFTILSNMLSATGALFMIPYAVEGIRKKRFNMPKWVGLFQYAGAVSVLITMFCAATIIAPTKGAWYAYDEAGIWLHLIVPILAIILFLSVESGHVLTKKDMIKAQIPFWIYGAIYTVMVVIIGEENGGWEDFYMATSILPFWIAALILFAIGFGASLILMRIHNRRVMVQLKQLLSQWPDDVTPIELRIEAFGLGRYMGEKLDKNEIIIPMDIIEVMSEKGDVSVEELVKAYTKGAMDAQAEQA